jgi:hypothetical protein
MSIGKRTSPLLRLAARLLAALALTGAQSAVAAHIHEIPRPASSASVRRADAQDAEAECPVCRLAGHSRAAAVAAPAAVPVETSFVVVAPRPSPGAGAPVAAAGARDPPAAR